MATERPSAKHGILYFLHAKTNEHSTHTHTELKKAMGIKHENGFKTMHVYAKHSTHSHTFLISLTMR